MPTTIFDRLSRHRPTSVEETARQPDPAQQLLTWLPKWPKQTVTARDIRRHAPQPLRNRESAINSINVLVRHGWLVPIDPRRRDRPEWEIVRRPIIHPEVA
jgi:hypothetical protein